ncbi:MAG: PepSY domain-containing protein [Pseudomonadota bacterium]
MTHTVRAVLLSALMVPGAVLAEINVGDSLGTTETAIQAALEAQGYTISEIEIEDGEIEAEVMLNGQELEIEVAADTGQVIEVAADEDDDDDDDDDGDDDDGDDDGDDDDSDA